MPDVQSPDAGRKLQLRYRLPRPATAFLSPEIVPVVLVDDLTKLDAQDVAFERSYVRRGSQAGNVTNRAIVELVNPPNSGINVFLKRLLFDVATASSVRISEPADLISAGTLSGAPTDGRVVGAAASALRLGLTVGTGLGNIFIQVDAGGSFPNMIFDLSGYVVLPGQMIQCTQQILNDTLSAGFWWTERPIE